MMPSRGKLYLLMLRFFNTPSVAFVLLFLQLIVHPCAAQDAASIEAAQMLHRGDSLLNSASPLQHFPCSEVLKNALLIRVSSHALASESLKSMRKAKIQRKQAAH